MRRLVHEPLVHFVVIGAALFVAFGLSDDDAAPADDEIVVSAGQIEHLATVFGRTWQRPPTRAELEGLIDDHVREEVAYREGMAIGLDTDDVIVRRRIRQKLEFVAEDLATSAEPTDSLLAAFLSEHAEAFQIEARVDLRQVYFGTSPMEPAAFTRHLDALNADPAADASDRGERTLLEPAYADISTRELTSLFGRNFADAVAQLEPGRWHGPVASSFGTHAVIIDGRRGGRIPELNEVRGAVLVEWQHARRRETVDAFYRSLLDKYVVTIEWPHDESNADLSSGSP